MRNVTVVLDDETALWTRIEAAKHDTSVSKYVGELLREQRLRDRHDEAAMEAFFARDLVALSEPGDRYPARDELYER